MKRGGLGLGCTSASIAAAAEELHVLGDDLAGAALLAFLVLVGPVLQPPLDVEGIAFLDVLGGRLGEPVPADDAVELGLLLALDRAVGSYADSRDGFAAARVPQLGIAGGVAGQSDQRTPPLSSRTAGCQSAGAPRELRGGQEQVMPWTRDTTPGAARLALSPQLRRSSNTHRDRSPSGREPRCAFRAEDIARRCSISAPRVA